MIPCNVFLLVPDWKRANVANFIIYDYSSFLRGSAPGITGNNRNYVGRTRIRNPKKAEYKEKLSTAVFQVFVILYVGENEGITSTT